MNLEDLTLTLTARLIRSGALSPVEYVQNLLSRIERLDPRLRAWVTVDVEGSLKEARACEAEARSGNFRGPLHGVPIGVKDIFYTKGLRTTAGSRILADFVPTSDATSVANLKQSGVILLGKTVTTEFATFDPGPTHNPWNLGHTPGGSSSGSAAAVAARMIPGAIGSQTVGSIGRPAAYCGVVGLMPTQARVSRKGVFPVGWSLDHVGCFGRSVEDVKLLLEGLSLESISEIKKKDPIRIGAVGGFFSSKASIEASELHKSVLKKIADAGVEIEEAALPGIFEIQSPILMTIMRAEIAAAHEEFYPNNSASYSARLRGLVETGMLIDTGSYLRAKRLRRIYQRDMAKLFDRFDILISPGAMDTAPEGMAFTGDPSFSGPWTLADFPTLTLPQTVASNGLPVAIQLSAPPMQEGLLLHAGALLEQIINFSKAPILDPQ